MVVTADVAIPRLKVMERACIYRSAIALPAAMIKLSPQEKRGIDAGTCVKEGGGLQTSSYDVSQISESPSVYSLVVSQYIKLDLRSNGAHQKESIVGSPARHAQKSRSFLIGTRCFILQSIQTSAY